MTLILSFGIRGINEDARRNRYSELSRSNYDLSADERGLLLVYPEKAIVQDVNDTMPKVKIGY